MPTTANDITAFTAGAIARLAAKAPGFAVEDFPDKPETYRLLNQNGAFLIAYRGADYTPSSDTSGIAQQRHMMIDVVAECRQLSGPSGIYVMLDLARIALLGFRVPGFSKLSLVRERFTARTEAVWIYTATFMATTLAVELDDDEVEPALLRLTLNSSFNVSEIPNA